MAMRFGANGICQVGQYSLCLNKRYGGEAFHQLSSGYQDVMLIGGSEASITPFALLVFSDFFLPQKIPKHCFYSFDKDRNICHGWDLVCWFWKVWNMLRSANLG